MGVMGPKKEKSMEVMALVANKYIDKENNIIPARVKPRMYFF